MSEETIPQMRETIEALQKQNKAYEGTIAELRGQLRVRDAREAFRQAGYNPKHGDLFAKDNPGDGEITAEMVADYARTWDLAPAASKSDGSAEEETTTDGGQGTDTLSSMSRSGTRAGEGGGGYSTERSMTRQEWMELQATDPVAASAALRQGRVVISTSGNVRSGQVARVGSNPYEPQVASDT